MTPTPLSREELEDEITNIFITIENYGTAEEARVDIRELVSKSLKAFADEVEPLKEAVTYMVSVWDEVTPGWREKPDHVAKKFIEAESALKDLLEKWGIQEAQDDK